MASELPEALRGLLLERAYPHRTQSIKVIGTHISWVILTGEFAYKIKRPVRYAFVDQRTPEQRAFLCHEELRLNRRFAPDLYLEVCPITLANGEARIGGPGQAVEHAVRMRQFPQSEQLNCLIRESRIASAELDAFGRALALLHDRLPRPAAAQQWGTPTAIRRIITDNLEECAQAAQAWATAAEWT
ncbi:MAG TPA: hypothetical protein VLX90_19355, partial [Steroidobacteraceae bacterium]|nr:hypothetical protein [Steroidobacteraceae bacterium]